MAYSTLADLIDRAGEDEILQVADRDGDDIPDTEVIAAALAGAENTINAYLARRYQLPLTAVPEIVQKWSTALARYTLHRSGPPDYVIRDYKDAMAELREAGAGTLLLPDAAGLTPTAGGADAARAEGSAPVFTPETLGGYL